MVDRGVGADKAVHDGDVVANVNWTADGGVFYLTLIANSNAAFDFGMFVGFAFQVCLGLGVEQVLVGLQPIVEFARVEPFALVFFDKDLVVVVD